MSTPLIQLRQARRVYHRGAHVVDALAGVDLTIQAGESWSIMGASGSGKSTLLNVLGCLDRLDSGDYCLDGQSLAALDDDGLSAVRLQRFGFIFQSFHLVPQLNVLENIELPLFYARVEPEQARRRAQDLARLVGLAERCSHRPSQLSGGQQQRVAIARALANDPPIVLADEPTGNLDSHTGDQIMDLLFDLAAQGKTLLMVTHNEALAARCRCRLTLHDGQIAGVARD
ncbi:MAG: ABC transporter ATP-binding protein [Desulfuromonadaceae bacterium]|nr:ABC transporter ATP-binding protein [Desulfuromonadaceae bacterium]